MPLVIEVKVTPSSGRQSWVLEPSGQLKCFLKNPPEDGKANKELVTSLAKLLEVQATAITIIAGQQVRKKVIRIDAPMTHEQFLNKLGFEVQKTIV
jgi:uncharacterized protein (TIGR00251 family)